MFFFPLVLSHVKRARWHQSNHTPSLEFRLRVEDVQTDGLSYIFLKDRVRYLQVHTDVTDSPEGVNAAQTRALQTEVSRWHSSLDVYIVHHLNSGRLPLPTRRQMLFHPLKDSLTNIMCVINQNCLLCMPQDRHNFINITRLSTRCAQIKAVEECN